jgi:O-methyltransferase involved in polyketide biosynthesis
VTAEFDPATPNMARVYDYWLGGKDNYPADRAEAQRLLTIYPPLRDLVRENRAFVTRAVNWAARQGIAQFIDLGAGLPATPSVHQAAREARPTARVAYVDIDAVVLSHARALLATSDGVTAVAADLRDPEAVLANPELRAVIDPARPVCVILGAVLHFLDADAARTVTAGYARLMAYGSCLVISVASFDDDTLGKQLAEEYTAAAWHNHTPADITSFFAGLELIGPGVTEAQAWRAWMPEPILCHREGHVLAGVAQRQAWHPEHVRPTSAVSGTSSPVAGSPEHHAVRHALAGNSANAAHGAGQPAIVEFEGSRQVGTPAAVGAVPFGGQGGQLPDGVDVAGPAVPQFVAAIVLAQHGVSPPPQLS